MPSTCEWSIEPWSISGMASWSMPSIEPWSMPPGIACISRCISGSAIMRWWTAGTDIRRTWAASIRAMKVAWSAGDMAAIRSRIPVIMVSWSIWPWSMPGIISAMSACRSGSALIAAWTSGSAIMRWWRAISESCGIPAWSMPGIWEGSIWA